MRLKLGLGLFLAGTLFVASDAALAHKSKHSQKRSSAERVSSSRNLSCANPRSVDACMVCNCYNEAGFESYAGQVAVGKVVMTRVGLDGFPKSICGVIKQPDQFSWFNKKSTRQTVPAGSSCFKASAEAKKFRGYFADHYYASYIRQPRWAKGMKAVKTIGSHKFYSANPSSLDRREQGAAVGGVASMLINIPALNGLIEIPDTI